MSLYERWKVLLPDLVSPLLDYLQRSAGSPCVPLPHALVASGMFPTAPSQPRTAVSIDLLDFYLALFERSGDAVTALARALRNFYTRRGWRILDSTGAPLLDPFRKPLGRAVQWYDHLRIVVERRIETAIESARCIVSDHLEAKPSPMSPTPVDTATAGPVAESPLPSDLDMPPSLAEDCVSDHLSASPGRGNGAPPRIAGPASLRTCATLLQRRCPACFGGDTFGRSFSEGADIIVAADGNFSHRHMRTAGDGPTMYDPEYFIPKAEVDNIGTFIDQQRKKPPNTSWVPRVPEEAVDNCKSGHEAADEQKAKTNAGRFDDTGVMALICSHDIPLFLVNIDTPGEQQKYILTLLIWLFKFLPPNATVCGLYDIGCVIERSIARYDLLPPEIASRLLWAVSAMHAYGHEWVCQLVYNPRLQPGLGLRDGEGVERLWSRLCVFILVTRTSARSRRIWILDRQAHAIGLELRDHLGIWMVRKLKHGVHIQYSDARKIVVASNVDVDELRRQWALQQAAQLSVRSHAPTQLKKEIDAVISLQQEIDRVTVAVKDIKARFKDDDTSPRAKSLLSWLHTTSSNLSERAEKLYTSLNISQMFPELKGVNAEFVRMLLLAHDIKIIVRKRVVAQLLEFDRIDRAAGGKDNPLGTKLHQQTRKAISRRQPTILTAIRKFNSYCDAIATMAGQQPVPVQIPIPRPLPTDLALLRDDPNLYEDVWITVPTRSEQPRWLEDINVRKAIRALLKMDRCVEEESRLFREANNMEMWFGRELAAIELAMRLSENSLFDPLLQQRRDDIALLQRLWASPLLSEDVLQQRMIWAMNIVREISPLAGSTIRQNPHSTDFPFSLSSTIDDEDDAAIAESETAVAESDYDLIEDVDYVGQDDNTNEDDNAMHESFEQPITISMFWAIPFPAHTPHIPCNRILPRSATSPRIVFTTDDYSRLADPDALLNSDCINECAVLLQRNISTPMARNCAIFSTYDVVSANQSNDGGALMRSVKRMPYWERNIWLIPIHRPGYGGAGVGHWTLVVVDIPQRILYQFDSFADETQWRGDVQQAWTLVLRLFDLASSPVPSDEWRALPLATSAVQHNVIDCGVWILTVIAARLRGYHMTSLTEDNLTSFRKYLCFLVTQLPESIS
ncbi:hypothetical protein CERSUDRAFT_54749 [Gelatoporia subvermispora B]|uniref:Ubiquitin-like protease family profile domain-containing protein n=1 Tax=Ceriporiopsis subvermispora (strain B) TaxID=914234 RepID=M2QRE7_CERS8|nr:hypothetical protein CERSUDRAFT_54749 [Gelatoporia subvermispora B]